MTGIEGNEIMYQNLVAELGIDPDRVIAEANHIIRLPYDEPLLAGPVTTEIRALPASKHKN